MSSPRTAFVQGNSNPELIHRIQAMRGERKCRLCSALQHITTTLDCTQVCAPRPPQLALGNTSLLSELRSSIRSNAKALKARHEPFRKSLPSEWTFCERLAKELGVLVLPAQFFCDAEDEREREALGLSERGWDRWLRFSVANVGDEEILQVCERLKESYSVVVADTVQL